MTRTFDEALKWACEGDQTFLDAVAALNAEALGASSVLPGWSRQHVVAHVAANAEALGNLVRWAATGVESPMYASPAERSEGIERGAAMPAEDLKSWVRGSADRLSSAMSALTDEQWDHRVVTAQGRTVAATEIPWMRAREVWVHVVDLRAGVSFADLPGGFLAALTAEIRQKRGLQELPDGPAPEIAAWLAGRPHGLAGAPEIGPWL
jgi:maleylpyruvate isomerase